MTQYTELGYLDQPYLDQDYGSGTRMGANGVQFEVTINSESRRGVQFEGVINAMAQRGAQFEGSILDRPAERGAQFEGEILNYPRNSAGQFQGVMNKQTERGVQFHAEISQPTARGVQFENATLDYGEQRGIQFLADINMGRTKAVEFLKNHYQSFKITGYLDDPYGEDPYLTGYFGPRLPVQALVDCLAHTNRGFQFKAYIADYPKNIADQFQAQIIDKTISHGVQFHADITQPAPRGVQFEAHILDKLKIYASQFLGNLNKETGFGVQYQVITQLGFGVQFLSTIYNTVYLRILHNFKSRGLSNTNWTANSQAAGDFGINNVDTDIEEQTYRSLSGTKSGIKLTCDIGAGQICYMDTLAIRNHNMTVGANIVMLMSNDPAFITGVQSVTIQSRRLNTYYIAPDLPTSGFRYFRLQIDDPSNSNDYIEIGNILFGAADIIQGENFTDEVDFEMVDFSDTINTEGFTNVSNSRALKRKLTLQFEHLDYEKRNYEILRNVFQTYRTTHKTLWIPTPNVTDQDITDRLAMFAKLVQVPKERHNNKGPGADYITFTVDLDESL